MKTVTQFSFLLAALAAAGCGNNTTTVSGRVSYNGKPVVFGTVVMVGANGVPVNGPIQPDGSFTVSGVPVGTVKVSVNSPPPPGANVKNTNRGRDGEEEKRGGGDEKPASPEVIKNWFVLPDKFGDPNKSGVTVTVTKGQPVTIELK